MKKINFEAKLFKIGSWTLIRLPESASSQLPSRGMTMVKGTINGSAFTIPLEPDGKKSHWFKVDETMLKAIKVNSDHTVKVEIEPTKEWPEPNVPEDIQAGLATNEQVSTLWKTITPAARWDWIRWIRATKNPETRKHRIEVACSKLKSGMRRPCCFNRAACTEPEVSNNGILMDPTQTVK